MTTYGWLLDPKKCIECRACEAACKQWNQIEIGINLRYRQVRVSETGVFPMVRIQALTAACNHCEQASCVKVCPTHALWRRDDGIVLIDREKCIGCELCAKFCPYQALQLNVRTKKIEKCTMCADRIDLDLQPACAALCPTGALQWGKWDELKNQGSDRIPGFSDPGFTKPRVRFAPQRWGQEATK
jgi:anaerobic dimethyl sulfoxide reductase subunit B (iron-sulfur subunit)